MKKRGNIKVGKALAKPDTPSHTPGIHEGNSVGNYEKMSGHYPDGTSDAARSTGIDPDRHGSIIPGSPNISPP